MKVAILTMFNGLDLSYSLVGVVRDHIAMLLEAEISVRVLVSEDCKEEERTGVFADERLEWVLVTNRLGNRRLQWQDYSQTKGAVHPTFYEEVAVIAEDFVQKLAGCDVCMMHDILYQGWHLIHNLAIRKAQKSLVNMRFLAFTHSMPIPLNDECQKPFDARFTPMEKTLFLYPTESGLPALASQYGVPLKRCKVMNHAHCPIHEMSKAAKKVCHHIDLTTPEIVMIYPARLTGAKGFEKVAAFAGVMKKLAKGVAVVFCDFPATDTATDGYKQIIRHCGRRFGLSNEDMLFTSDVGYPMGFPHEGVQELFSMANLFVCPSRSESFGLTVLEAAAAKNMLVLNEAVPALLELGERLGAYFLRWNAVGFGIETFEAYHPSEEAYYLEHCEIILRTMRENSVICAHTILRQQFHPKKIFETQLLPLLESNTLF